MKGSHRIIVETKRIKYDFTIKRNVTIIAGNSATGKTTLIEMIQEFYENQEQSGIILQCDKSCVVLEGRQLDPCLGNVHDSIVFIDGGNSFITLPEFADWVKESDNYFVIATREELSLIPNDLKEIDGLRRAGKSDDTNQKCNELYRIC